MSGKWLYAEYTTFSLDSEANQYAINISGYVGDAGDSLANISLPSYCYHNGMKFTTIDEDNDLYLSGNCGLNFRAGWWFNSCGCACLTCESPNFVWYSLTYASNEPNALLKAVRMMIKSN